MRILLDSRDLINLVEHDRPVAAQAFDRYLRDGNHEIVLTFTNVRELCGPLAADGDFLRVPGYLQSAEQMPHTYMKEAMIFPAEIQSAVNAFNRGRDARPMWRDGITR